MTSRFARQAWVWLLVVLLGAGFAFSDVTTRYDYDAFGTLLGASGESPLGSDAYLYRGDEARQREDGRFSS